MTKSTWFLFSFTVFTNVLSAESLDISPTKMNMHVLFQTVLKLFSILSDIANPKLAILIDVPCKCEAREASQR